MCHVLKHTHGRCSITQLECAMVPTGVNGAGAFWLATGNTHSPPTRDGWLVGLKGTAAGEGGMWHSWRVLLGIGRGEIE